MTWTIEYARSVQKTVRKLSPDARRRIRDFLEHRLASMDNPRELGRPLKGRLAQLWRYRVGELRVICELRDSTLIVLVVHVGRRDKVYK